MKVLLVDDEEAILDVFKQALEQAQFEVVTALNGAEGIDKSKSEHPDVIFLDQILPDMNGNQVLQLLKADPDTKAIPVAILSNFSQDTLVASAMKMGASEYILKYQIAPADLVAKATTLMENVHAAPPPEQFIPAGQSAPLEAPAGSPLGGATPQPTQTTPNEATTIN